MRNIMAGGNYERLTPRERLSLLTDAKARADEVEMRRLYDTAPMQAWRIMDYEFTRGRDVLWDLVRVVCIQLSDNFGKLHIIEKMRRMTAPVLQLATLEAVPKLLDVLEGDIAVDADKMRQGEDPLSERDWQRVIDSFTSEARDRVERVVQTLWDDAISEAAAILASFDRLTRRVLDLDAVTVLRAWAPPTAEAIEQHRIMDCTPDLEAVNLWAAIWAQSWNRRMGIKTTDERSPRNPATGSA